MGTLLCISEKGDNRILDSVLFRTVNVGVPALTALSSRVVSAFLTGSGMIYVSHRKCLVSSVSPRHSREPAQRPGKSFMQKATTGP